jgi:predicted phosphoribosyltransferase
MASFPLSQRIDETNTDEMGCFADRHQAGENLAQAVRNEIEANPPLGGDRYLVYALPRGGLPVAAPIARLLHCPLAVIVAKKITSPDNRELAIGAVTADGHVLWPSQRRSRQNATFSLSPTQTKGLAQAQTKARAQQAEFAAVSPQVNPAGAIALVVDDGIATGMTMAVAVQSLRSYRPAQIWICAPVAPLELLSFLESISDRLILLATPSPFYSVSRFYQEFPQVSMEEALEELQLQCQPGKEDAKDE